MLKQEVAANQAGRAVPAAFGRLCVETNKWQSCTKRDRRQPPSGGCVLKLERMGLDAESIVPAAFGRLCVETSFMGYKLLTGLASRLRAAVC